MQGSRPVVRGACFPDGRTPPDAVQRDARRGARWGRERQWRPLVNRGDIAVEFNKELDARGLSCPLPILKTKKMLNELTSGQVLKVVATDPGSIRDMEAFANQTGNPLLSSTTENKDFIFFLRKK
jgi:tRNA 2-thiouridine synthesizing protein A